MYTEDDSTVTSLALGHCDSDSNHKLQPNQVLFNWTITKTQHDRVNSRLIQAQRDGKHQNLLEMLETEIFCDTWTSVLPSRLLPLLEDLGAI